MKKQTLAACVFAAITLGVFSCYLFSKKDKIQVTAEASIVGRWQLTGISDSGRHTNSFTKPFFASFNPDSVKAFANFNADSGLNMSYSNKQLPETTRYYIDTAVQKLIIKDNSKYDTLSIATLNDSLLQLTSDSIYFELKRLP